MKNNKKNWSLFRISLFILFFVLLNTIPAFALDYTWDGGGDGISWHDELNWTPDSGVPGSDPSDIVYIWDLSGGTVDYTSDAGTTSIDTLRVYSGGTLRLTGGSLTVSNLMYVQGSILQTGGTLAPPPNFQIWGSFLLSSGTLNLTGTANIFTGGTFDYAGGIISGGGNINNGYGTTIFTIPVGASIVINDIFNNGTFYSYGEPLQYSNQFINSDNGTILGTGTIYNAGVSFLNFGTVNPGDFQVPGILNFNEYFTMDSVATLDIELGGTTAGTDYDQVAVIGGDASLNGSLNVTLIDLGLGGGEFNPALGDSFTVLTVDFGQVVNGTFNKVNLPALDPGLDWHLEYNTLNVKLDVVPKWIITPEIMDFDNTNVGDSSETQTFTFTNRWTGDINIATASLTGSGAGQFTLSNNTCTGQVLAADASCSLDVTFNPTVTGLQKAEVAIPVNGFGATSFTAQLSGTGINEDNPFTGKWGHINLSRKHSGPTWESGGGSTVLVSGPNTGLSDDVENDDGVVTERTDWTTTSYTSTARKDGSFILEMTDAVETDWDRHVLADNDTMVVTDKTWESDRQGISLAIRMDEAKTYSNADLSGEYYVIGYEYESGVKRSWSEVITADGAGTFDRVSTRNEDGTPSTDSQNGIPYTVAADGTVDYAGANYTSFLSGDGSLAVITHPRENNPANPKFRFLMKKGDRAYTTADLEGNWAFAMFGDDKFGEFLSGFGSLYCDSNGNCRMALRGQKGGQTVYQYAQLGRMSVNPDGSIDSLDNPGTPAYSAAIGNNGNTFINNDSFGLNTDQRMIIIGVKAEASYNLAGWPLPFMNIDLNSPYDNSIKHMLHLPEDGSGGFLKKSSYDSWEAGIAENGTMVTTEGIEDGPYDMTVFDIPTKNLTLIDTATTKRAAFPYYDESAPKERILYLDSNNDGALKRMETDGTIIIEPPLASPTAGWWFDTFWMGPFGKQLVVVETDGTNIKLVYMLVDGSSQVELTPVEEGKWYNVSWRPDGKGIFYYWGLSNDGYNDTYYVIDLSNMAAYSQLNDVYDLSLRDLDQPGNIVAYTKTGNLLSLTYQELYDANGNFLADVSAQVPLLDSTFFGHDPIGKVFFADLDGTNIRPFVEPISSQITDDAFNDYNPQVNDNGYVVWRGNDGNDDEIYLYNGTSTIQLTDNDYSDGLPQINGSGQVVWLEINTTGGVNDIYFYDNALPATNITLGTNAWAWRPQINDNGDIVWADNRNDGEIYLKEYGASTITLSELDGVNTLEDANPQINNNGYVVWRRDDPDGEIMLYDGSTITKLTDNTTYDGSPQINNNNYVVWSGSDGSDYEIFLYDGTNIIQLTDNAIGEEHPQINDNGYVVWSAWDGTDTEIFLYDGATVTQLTDNLLEDVTPQINNNGYVVWRGHDGNENEIFLYDGAATTQLTDNDFDDSDPRINNGYMVWSGSDDTDFEIFFSAVPASTKTLSVALEGSGSGTVTSSPAGIDCGTDCSQIYDTGTVVDLTPTPAANSLFVGWSGDADCLDGQVIMSAARTCTAIFEPGIWSYDTSPVAASRLVLQDINSDGYDELLLLEDDETLRIISGADGTTELWNYQVSVDNRYRRGLTTINDLDGDGIDDIIVILGTSGNDYDTDPPPKVGNQNDDVIYAISGAVTPPGNRVLWENLIGCGLSASIVLPDVNGDGFDDIYANTISPSCAGYGDVGYHFSGADGTVLWNSDVNSIWDIYGRTVTPDLNGDSLADIITAGAGGSVGVEAWQGGATKSVIWTALPSDWIRTPTVLGHVTYGDSIPEIGVSKFNTAPFKVIVLNGETGATLWDFTIDNYVSTIGDLGDVDGDSHDDVVIGTYDGGGGTDFKVYALKGEPVTPLTDQERIIWSYDVGVNNWVTVVPDINGDSIKDVLVNGANSKILGLSGVDGTLIYQRIFTGTTGTPQLGEFDNLAGSDYLTNVSTILYTLPLGESNPLPDGIQQITDNDVDDIEPRVNDSGTIVWNSDDGNDNNDEIFLYNGTTTIQLTNNSYIDHDPHINNNGHVVWRGADASSPEINYYNGSTTIQLTDDFMSEGYNQINDNNHIVWYDWDGSDGEIYLYDGATTTRLTDDPYYCGGPQINDDGYVVWKQQEGIDAEIFLYDGITTTQLTNNTYEDRTPQINNNGFVVWEGGAVGGGDSEIFLYNGTEIIQLTDNSFPDTRPRINDNGFVVWDGFDGTDLEIFLYNGAVITQLTDNTEDDWAPEINSYGYIVWQGLDNTATGDTEIFLYDGVSVTQITDNEHADYVPQISNGYMAWQGYDGNDFEIFMKTLSISASTFNVSAAAGAGGAIDPSGDVSVANGGSQTFTFTPDAGYYIYDVLVNGDSVGQGLDASYTFATVTGNSTIEVLFTQPPVATGDSVDGTIIAPAAEPALTTHTLTTSASGAPDTASMAESYWRVRRADMPPFSLADLGVPGAGPDYELVDLAPGLKYIWQVSYKYDNTNNSISPWSDEYGFLVGIEEYDAPIPIVEGGIDVADYVMRSITHWPSGDSSCLALMGSYDTRYLRIGTYNAMEGAYDECGPDLEIVPGRAYWVLARNGFDETIDGVPVSLEHDIEVPLDYGTNGWNMVGPPNKADYYWAKVKIVVYNTDGTVFAGPFTIDDPDASMYIDTSLWSWDSGNYISELLIDNPIMYQNEGYWVQVLQPNVSLRFPWDPVDAARVVQVESFSPVEMFARQFNKGLFRLKQLLATSDAVADAGDSPPLPMGGFTDSASAAGAGGGCFIATAAYGSYLAPEVMHLRHFRDNVLLTNTVGKYFVKQYYAYSPPMADFIAEHKTLRFVSRIVLTPLVYMIAYPLAGLFVFLLFAAVGGVTLARRRRAHV